MNINNIKKNLIFMPMLLITIVFTNEAFSDIDGPYYWEGQATNKRVDHQNGSKTTANSNIYACVDWSASNSDASVTSTSYTIEGDDDAYVMSKFGMTPGTGTSTLSYSTSGSVPGVGSSAPSGACNYHQCFLAYEAKEDERYFNIRYYSDGTAVADEFSGFGPINLNTAWIDILEDPYSQKSTAQQTYKMSYENYSSDNYPRPNPYILLKDEGWKFPGMTGVLVSEVGEHYVTSYTARDWS